MARKRNRFISKRCAKQDTNDVCLNDFANAPVSNGGGRLKKSNIVVAEESLEDDRPWYEKVDDLALVPRKRSTEREQKLTTDSGESGNDYPIDIWFLIADHVDPEDVGRFAGICRSSYIVVNSAKFWFSLYNRFYRPVDNLPEILQPVCMVRRYGLRALVIRSLYFFYRPFRNRLHHTANSDPHRVTGRRCAVAWSQKIKGRDHWVYSFKLELTEPNIHCRRDAKPKPDLWEMLLDINVNVDHNCKILQIKSNSYHPLPMLSGQILLDCKMKMAADFGSHTLQLQFGCGPSHYQPILVSINNVTMVRELDWWHPNYTHNESLHDGLFSSTLSKDCDFFSTDS